MIDVKSQRNGLVIALVSVLVAILYFQFFREPASAGVHIESTPAKELAKVTTEKIKTTVVVYHPQAKKRLSLPVAVQQDPEKHVVAATRTPADERPHTVTTILDSGNGKITTYDRADPLPLVAVNRKSEVGLYYGMKDGEQSIRIEGRHELLQVKALHLGATASADITPGDVDGFVGVGVWARW